LISNAGSTQFAHTGISAASNQSAFFRRLQIKLIDLTPSTAFIRTAGKHRFRACTGFGGQTIPGAGWKVGRRLGGMAAHAFADPDPFWQLTYAPPLEAKRAIAQCLGRALSTLSTAQLEAINLVVATTLKKQEVLGQLCACLAHPRGTA
jgi:hypothetical protein